MADLCAELRAKCTDDLHRKFHTFALASGKEGAEVRAFPGRTSFELALATDLDRYMLARRLPECETGRAVKRGEPKRCSVTGKLAMTWYAA